MSLAVRPDSNRQHLVFYSAVILQHNKAMRSLRATPGTRTASEHKRVGWVSVFQSKQPSSRSSGVPGVTMQPHMALHLSLFLPKALHNFRGSFLDSTLVEAWDVITQGMNIKITLKNRF